MGFSIGGIFKNVVHAGQDAVEDVGKAVSKVANAAGSVIEKGGDLLTHDLVDKTLGQLPLVGGVIKKASDGLDDGLHMGVGVAEGLTGGMAQGLTAFLAHPIKTSAALCSMALHPERTVEGICDSVKNSQDPWNAFGNVLSMAVPLPGAAAAGLGKVAALSADTRFASMTARLAKATSSDGKLSQAVSSLSGSVRSSVSAAAARGGGALGDSRLGGAVSAATGRAVTRFRSVMADHLPGATLSAEKLTFGEGRSVPVCSNAQKFILPVPKFGEGGEPLVHPPGTALAGQAIKDWEGKPIGDHGLVFFNHKDQAVQAVRGDGQGVVIMNEVTPAQASKLTAKVQELAANPNDLDLAQTKTVLDYAHHELGLGDMYNSDRGFVQGKMTRVTGEDVPATDVAEYGLMKRDDRDVLDAVHVPGNFKFQGPAAGLQQFENGGYIVRDASGSMRGIQPDVFLRTYRGADGSALEAGAVPSASISAADSLKGAVAGSKAGTRVSAAASDLSGRLRALEQQILSFGKGGQDPRVASLLQRTRDLADRVGQHMGDGKLLATAGVVTHQLTATAPSDPENVASADQLSQAFAALQAEQEQGPASAQASP